jgi:hypothetical protein
MRKLKLDVEALQVESFEAVSRTVEGGTVHGQEIFEKDPVSTECDGNGWGSLFGTCAGCPTVGTCVGPTYCCPPTWQPTCNPTCNRTDCGNPCSI